jgi:hypothetical protein
MINTKKIQKYILKTIEDSGLNAKIQIFFSQRTVGTDFDPYEKNYTYTNQNPLTIKGYITDVSPEALVWKQYGLTEVGMKEITCNSKYAQWFRICNKIEINGDTYQVYKENVGNRLLITELPLKLIRVIVSKVK